MQLQHVWVLNGPNIWAKVPLLEVELDPKDAQPLPPEHRAAFRQRLQALLPLSDLTGDIPDALWRVALSLQVQAGSPVKLGGVPTRSAQDCCRVIIEFEEEPLGRAALEAAHALCEAALAGQPFDLPARLEALRELAYDIRLGPSTAAIVRAARNRDIPTQRLNTASLVQLGHGARQHRILTAETDRTSAIAEAIAQDKQLTRALLRSVGVPVPEGQVVSSAEEAWEAAQELGVPVVVKPQYGNHGRGVATNLSTREQVIRAYEAAREEGSSILVETFIPGVDFRLLVVGDRLVSAALREPAQVVGDGRSTVTQLIEEVNRDPRRSDGHSTVLSFIKLDPVALGVLAEQGHAPDSVPAAGERVLIRRNGNLSTGGTATDVTDKVHPDVAARAVDAARAVGLDIAGVDVVALDISRPLEEQHGAVVEVNAGPGLRMHLEPSAGKPRPVGEAIVALLFPEGQTGRIPIVAVTGVNGKTTTTRIIDHLLRQRGLFVGMTCTDGIYLNGRRIDKHDCSGPRSARTVLLNPRVEAAVFETARGGILRRGLGFDTCNVAVVTNVGEGDHLSLHGIETLEDLARVKRTVVEAVAPTGTAVLNAAEPLVAAMATHCPGRVIFFAETADDPVVTSHLAAGGRAVFVRAGKVVLAEGRREEELLVLEQVPLTHGGRVGFQVRNVLAAVAAAWALALPAAAIRRGLESFTGDPEQVPGRFNVLSAGGATVIVDFAHNPSAFEALIDGLPSFAHERRVLVFSSANRRDEDVVRMGELAGAGFDRVLLYRDRGGPDRADGELTALLRRGLASGRRVADVVETSGEREAIDAALGDLRPGDLLVLGIEAIEDCLELVQMRLGDQAMSDSSPFSRDPQGSVKSLRAGSVSDGEKSVANASGS